MANSLQEQLLQAGLVDKNKLNKAKKAKQQKQKQQRHAKQKNQAEATLLAKQAMAKDAERDRELNRRKQETAQRKAIAAEIEQLIRSHKLPQDEGEIAYNFTEAGKIRRIHVNEKIQAQLGRGSLAIVKSDERYELVPTDVAEKIAQRDASRVIVHNSGKQQEADADDPYAEFKVPDDLMW